MLPSLCLMYVVYYISLASPPALKWIYLIVFLLHNKSQREKRIFHDVFLCQFIISPVIVKFTIPQCRPHIEFCVHNIIWLLSYHKDEKLPACLLLSPLLTWGALCTPAQHDDGQSGRPAALPACLLADAPRPNFIPNGNIIIGSRSQDKAQLHLALDEQDVKHRNERHLFWHEDFDCLLPLEHDLRTIVHKQRILL